LVTVWAGNFLWSFSDIALHLGLLKSNAVMALTASLVVGCVANIMIKGEKAYFKSQTYLDLKATNN
jgi:SSS family solute:Na+ symporter